MSIYDYRDRLAYNPGFFLDPQPYKNKNISKWWTTYHDKLIEDLIEKYQWHWYWYFPDEAIKVIPREIADSLDKQWTWDFNKVMHFALNRSKELGLIKYIRKPKWKDCPLCNEKFVEDSLPAPLTERLGMENLDFCALCLRDTMLRDCGNNETTKENIISYLRELTDIIQRVPPQGYGEGIDDFGGLTYEQRVKLLTLLKTKPTLKRIKKVFGSWLNALVEAEILEDGTRQTPRGIQTLARDGHVCFSLGEKTIDDFLFDHNIEHKKEPRYPEGNYRADFLVGKIFIEYFGFAGNPDYDKRMREKISICNKRGISLIELYPKDLMGLESLSKKLLVLIS